MSLLGTPSKVGLTRSNGQTASAVLHSTPTKHPSSACRGLYGIKDTPEHLYGLDVETNIDQEFNASILTTDGNQSVLVENEVAVNQQSTESQNVVSFYYKIRAVASKMTGWIHSIPGLFWIVFLSVIIIISAVLIQAFLKGNGEELPCSQEKDSPVADQEATDHSQAKLINELKAEIKELSSLVSGMSGEIAKDASTKKKETISKEELTRTLEEYLDAYNADKVGLPDYALEASGAKIHKPYVSPTNTDGAAKVSMFGVPVFIDAKDPSVILQPEIIPGNCWPLKGHRGYVVIQLAQPVIPLSFTLEHIPKALSLTGDYTIPTAPKEFSVFGWHDEHGEKKTLLGNYIYDSEKKPLQTFAVKLPLEKNTIPFAYVELIIHSNYGDPEYTCLYRFRVHGQPKHLAPVPHKDNDENEMYIEVADSTND